MKIEKLTDVAVVLEPKDRMVAGLDLLSRTVQTTLGPAGQFVGLQMKLGQPTYTKDGVNVARHVWSEDPVENSAIQTVVGAAMEMNNLIGDGTTTTVILAVELARQLLQLTGRDYRETLAHLRRYFNVATDAVKERIVTIENKLGTLKAVATIACNGDEVLSTLVAEAVHAVGRDGVVAFQDSPSGEPYYEVTQGMIFDRGYASSHFLVQDDQAGKIDFGGQPDEACLVFVSADTLAEAEEVLPILQTVDHIGQPLLLIAPDIVGNALGMMIINRKQGRVHSCAIRAPGSGERRLRMLEDIALATGGRLFATNHGKDIREFTPNDVMEHLGKAGRVLISDKRTVLFDAGGEEEVVEAHIASLKQAAEDNPHERKRYQERIAQLAGGVGSVFVPGYNNAEKAAHRFLVEDGISACMAALRGGILPGGCCAFKVMLQAVRGIEPKGLNDVRAKEIFLKTVTRPVELLIANALEGGEPGHDTFDMMGRFLREKRPNWGVDISTMQFANLDKTKIWEPALVPLTALRIAFSCATTLGNTKAMIVQRGNKK